MALSDYLPVVLADTPIAFWPMQEAGIPLVDLGSSGVDIDTEAGSPVYQVAGPSDAFFVSFPTAADHVQATGSLVTIGANQPFTVETWIKADNQTFPPPASGYADCLSFASAGTLFWAGNTASFTAHNKLGFIPSGFAGFAGTTMVDATEYQVVYKRAPSSANIEIWIDGVLDQTIAATAGAIALSTPMMGNNMPTGYEALVSVYDYELTGTQINAHRDALLFGPPCNPPVNAGGSDAPVITGTAEVGEVLSTTDGTWTGDPTITFTYAWYRLCGTFPEEQIIGETASTYEVTEDDIGCDIFARVIASNGCAPDGEADTDTLGPVPDCNPPVNGGGADAPHVSGSPYVGSELTVTTGTWTGDATITFDYQWYRDCGSAAPEAITGETTNSYTVDADDLGCDLFCTVGATNDCGSGEVDSNTVGPVTLAPPVNITPPVATGIASPGHAVATTDGTWDGDEPITYTYQWYLDCGGGFLALVGQTGPTLDITGLMLGCSVRAGVVAHNVNGASDEAFSNTLGPVFSISAAGRRFYQSPFWRFVVVNLATLETLSFLDHIASERTVTYVLNKPAVATGRVPSDNPEVNIPWPSADSDPFLAEGNRALLGFRREGALGSGMGPWRIRFSGILMQIEDTAQSDDSWTSYNAFDGWQYLFNRPVRNGPDFDYTLPGINGSSYGETRIDVIAAQLLRNTIHEDGTTRIDAGPDYGGTEFWNGTIQECAQIDINFSQGTTVGEAWQQLTNMDGCDIILTPIYDPINRPGYLWELNIFTQAGATVDDAIFAWDKPSRSLTGINRLKDGTVRANKVKYFAGIGGTANNGQNVPVQTDAASVAKYGEYWRQQFWPGQRVASAVELLAAAQLELSKDGRTTVAISPSPQRAPSPFTDYFLGDRVPVYASERFREPVRGYQRIYGIPIVIEDDTTETIQQMLTAVQS